MTANKLFLYMIISIMVLGIAHATASAVATHNSIDKNSVSFILNVNETVKATLYLCSVSTCNGGTAYAITGNDTEFLYGFSTLTPNTLYYYKWNGTAEVTNAVYQSNIGSVTTEDYKITGITKTILNFFVFIFISVFGVLLAFKYSGKIYDAGGARALIAFLLLILLCTIFLNTLIAAILGL